jgi:hypothetical protein
MSMKKRNKKAKRRILKRVFQRKCYNRTRKRLLRRIYNGAIIPKKIRTKYNVKIYPHEFERRRNDSYVPGNLKIDIPSIFCLIKDPEGTSAFLVKLKKSLNTRLAFNLNISHEITEEIGLAASFLFDKMIKDYRAKWYRRGIKIGLFGTISKKSKQVNNFILSYGLLKTLGISIHDIRSIGDWQIDEDYENKYFTIKIDGSKRQSFKKSEASTDLVSYFNKCFNSNDLQIAETARQSLVETFGEIIGNAEEHCGNINGTWHSLGCYDKEQHLCKFAIINFGKTVYENLSDENSTAFEVVDKIRKVINSNRRWLDGMKQRISANHDEPIWNVMALQDGISSKRTEHGKGRTRGQGIMDVLTFIDEVKSNDEGANLCFVSGRSAIIIDYEYPINNKEIKDSGERRKIMAFNKKGDLHEPPDPRKVIFLKDRIEGTIFSGQFKIDGKYLKEKMENKNGKGN